MLERAFALADIRQCLTHVKMKLDLIRDLQPFHFRRQSLHTGEKWIVRSQRACFGEKTIS